MSHHFKPDEEEQWTHRLVSAAYARALFVMRAIPTRIGPAGDRAFWPETYGEEDCITDDEPRFRPKLRDITQAEIALIGFEDKNGRKHPGWLNGALVAYPELRTTFSRWAIWASLGKRGFDGLSETEDDFANRQGMSESSLRRQREKAAGIIAMNLNEAGLKVWHVEKPPRKNKPRERSAA